jgi:hypothetical protein
MGLKVKESQPTLTAAQGLLASAVLAMSLLLIASSAFVLQPVEQCASSPWERSTSFYNNS